MIRGSAAGILLTCFGLCSAHADESVSREIDQHVWSAVSRTVAEDDIKGMSQLYHPDAVIVSAKGTAPITGQLVKWGQGMEAQKQQGIQASASFRFSSRSDNDDTAFETGVFKYTTGGPDLESKIIYVRFESLLIKKSGRWLILMERQLEEVDEAVWTALE